MDRRILVGIAVVAAVAAVVLGWTMMPVVGEPEGEALALAPAPDAKPGARPAPHDPKRPSAAKAGADGEEAGDWWSDVDENAEPTEEDFAVPPEVIAALEQKPRSELEPEQRCASVTTQGKMIAQMMSRGRRADAEPDEARVAALRVAAMAAIAVEEAVAISNGELSCGDIPPVNLGPAADFLAEVREQQGLDEQTVATLDRALETLDAVDWPEDGKSALPPSSGE